MGAGLEPLVVTLNARRVKRLRTVLALAYDNQSGNSALRQFLFERDFSHKQFTSSLPWERAKEIRDQLKGKDIDSALRRFGQPDTESERWTVIAFLPDASSRDLLPEEFIVSSAAVYAPRTNPFFRRSNPKLQRVEEHLQALGYRPVEQWRRTEHEYRIVRSLKGEYRAEVAPMRYADFKVFAGKVAQDPVLRKYFQIWEYKSRPFKTREEAKALFKEAKASLNRDRWFRHHIQLVPTTHGIGLARAQCWLVRAYSAVSPGAEENPLFALGLRPNSEPSCWRSYRDTGQQDEQRRHVELEFPAFHGLGTDRQPNASELGALTEALERHVAGIDLEVVGYLKEKWAPHPSGLVVHAVLRSINEKLLFAIDEFAPREAEVDGYSIIRCADEVDLLQKLNQAANKYAFLACHNGRGYDQAHLAKANARWSRKRLQEKIATHVANLSEAQRADPTIIARIKQDLEETAATINRNVKGVKGRPWQQGPLIDTYLFFRKRPHLFTGLGLEGITGRTKEEVYVELERNFKERTPKGLFQNAIYSAADGERTWDVLLKALPALVAESFASGRPIPSVAASAPYHDMKEIKEKQAARAGRFYRSHLRTRPAIANVEQAEKKSARAFSALRWPVRRSGLWETSVAYNPLVARAFRPELTAIPELRMLGDRARGTGYQLAVAIATAEYYLAPLLRIIYETLGSMQPKSNASAQTDLFGGRQPQAQRRPKKRTIFQAPSADVFAEAACRLLKVEDLPNLRLAREHQFNIEFNVINAYKRLSHTAQELARLLGDRVITGVGPFLVGELPTSLGYFSLGSGHVAVFGHGRKMLAELTTPNGDIETIAWGVKIAKADAGARPDLREAMRFGSPLRYEPRDPRTQDLYDKLRPLFSEREGLRLSAQIASSFKKTSVSSPVRGYQ